MATTTSRLVPDYIDVWVTASGGGWVCRRCSPSVEGVVCGTTRGGIHVLVREVANHDQWHRKLCLSTQ